ncbi:CRISPR-associated RAMP protein, Cmr4 family [Desulfofundulus kuznetsovii DSM 6115]|uniref:CRISPR-associated RAMP protein, Cmr4 family n=1 Tax=Desulfofundulus kuznetsovii (strain DSM 6115 / VKM B-1805 / 17) TaxID=760568 RepID=A0AAU8P8J3_DESK7|nr:CRISPR-associated RAMP protein, Cmr4 family [Desulfofundulus kuznetsovii DSM 6115]
MEARLLFVHALSPLHAGTGQGVGVIDLPVAREKATGLPYLPGSSLKGVLRDACRDNEMRKKVFGPDTDSAHEHAGSVQISDQRLLLLPVRSLKGTFAWVTSPYILRRFLRDAENVGVSGIPSGVPVPTLETSCLVSNDGSAIMLNNQVILEDLDLTAETNSDAREWAEWIGRQVFPDDTSGQEMLNARFCVVHDDVMSFLLDTATEVFARVRLREDAKTVETGGLWYEEALPAETVLAGLILATPVKAEPDEVFKTLNGLMEKPLQIGGKATVGRGLCRLRMIGGN